MISKLHEQMASHRKLLCLLGVGLTILGSFLPWEQGGDFTPYWRPGIHIYHVYPGFIDNDGIFISYPGFVDTGGFLIILLSVALVILIYRPPSFVKKPHLWFLGFAVVLALISAYYIGDIMIRHVKMQNAVGSPTVQYGLMIVSLGSLLLVVAGL